MARKRMIDPNIWTSVQVARLSVLQRLLYIGLISNADDEGRLNGDPTYIKGIIFPHDNITPGAIEDCLKRIARVGLIVRYRVGRGHYILHPNWRKYQTINKALPSRLPPPNAPLPNILPDSSGSATVGLPHKTTGLKTTEQKGNEEKTTGPVSVDPIKSLSLLLSQGIVPASSKWFAENYPFPYIQAVVAYCRGKARDNPAGMIMQALREKWDVGYKEPASRDYTGSKRL